MVRCSAVGYSTVWLVWYGMVDKAWSVGMGLGMEWVWVWFVMVWNVMVFMV